MKKTNFLFLSFALLFSCFLVSCTGDTIEYENRVISNEVQTRAVPTPSFNWETADWMPTPVGQSRISTPWIGAGSISSVHGIEILNDHKASDGWEMMYNSFDPTSSGPLVNPYFVLYNKYRGLMDIYLYITTQFVATSSYLQDNLSVISTKPSSLLMFLGQDIVDPTTPQQIYSQIQPAPADGSAPLAANRWYMLRYELAYDPTISSMKYDDIRLNWALNYKDISQIKLGGKLEGKINGTVGAAGSLNPISALLPSTSEVGNGVLSWMGVNFLENNSKTQVNSKDSNNKLGLSNDVFSAIKNGVSSILSGSTGDILKKPIKFLSAILGGSSGSGPMPINLRINANMTLEGGSTSGGAFPSTPILFWMPGTNIPSTATGYIPLYNKPLGVIGFTAKPPTLDIHTFTVEWEETDEPVFDPDAYHQYHKVWTTRVVFPKNIDYSNYVVFNPEIKRIAKVTIEKQSIAYMADEMVVAVPENYANYEMYWESNDSSPLPDGIWEPTSYTKMGIRFIIKVEPYDGTPSSIIVKTLAIDHRIIESGRWSTIDMITDKAYGFSLEEIYRIQGHTK